MKSDCKNLHFKRGRGFLGALRYKESLKENESDVSNFQENNEEYDGHTPRTINKIKSQRKRLISSKLSKSLTEKTNSLNFSSSSQKIATSKVSRLKKRSIQSKNLSENIENKQESPKTLRERTPLKSLIASCFDETSNHSVGSSNYSTVSSSTSESSDSLNTYSLNLTSTEITSKYFELRSEAAAATFISFGAAEAIQKPAETVLVPSFREKKYKWYYNLECTENISDQAYSKRHQKLENDEIKMQRWDRIRQKNELERQKLLQKENKHQLVTDVKQTSLTCNSNGLYPESDVYIIQILDDDLNPKPIEPMPEMVDTIASKRIKRSRSIHKQAAAAVNDSLTVSSEEINNNQASKRRRLVDTTEKV